MSYLKRTLRNAVSQGISKGIGDAIGKAVQQAVEPKATEYANKAAQHIDRAAGSAAQQTRQSFSGLEGAFADLERSMQGYATQMSKNMKICPGCGQPAGAEKTFCPACGSRLPDQTVAEGAVCPGCGKQNSIGMRFCADCGTKLPAAVQEEQLQLKKDEAELARWDTVLAHFPKWNCGGNQYNLEEYDPGALVFSASFDGDATAAHRAVEAYRQHLLQTGFRQAGRYPSMEHLYKKVGGVCYHVDTEHCFEGDPDRACIGFGMGEPSGGFDYVKPEPAQKVTLKDLKSMFKF